MPSAAARLWLKLLLRLYPRRFREEMGEDLLATLHYRHRELTGRSRLGAARFWLTEGLRFGVDGLLERIAALFTMMSEIGPALRQVRRAPAQQVLAVITLALGIGATTTIATIADAVMFRALPYPDAHALYQVRAQFGGMQLGSNSLANVRDLQASVRSVEWFAGARSRNPALSDAFNDPARVRVVDVTEQYLPGLGARLQSGRAFASEDFKITAPRVAVISDELWKQRWGGDAAAIGATIRLDGVEHTVIGVMSARFRDPDDAGAHDATALWLPARAMGARDDYRFSVLARLRDGVPLAVAAAELTTAGARLSAAYPDANRLGGATMNLVLLPLHEVTVGNARPRLLLLLGAVGILLLLSCANAANLFFARGATRTPELVVRTYLGATRYRLSLQLFAESLVTALVAAVLGSVLAFAGIQAFVTAAPGGIPRLHEITLDMRVAAVVALLTVITAILSGTIPSLRAARDAAAVGTSTRVTPARHAQRVQSVLVAIEVALALLLVTSSALLLNSLRHVIRTPPGFAGDDVIVAELRPPPRGSHETEIVFHRALLERARALPGVHTAALLHSPPGGSGGTWTRVTTGQTATATVSARRVAPAADALSENFYRVNAMMGDAFAALDIPLVAGRSFGGDAGSNDPLVVIINEAAAQQFFPHVENPVGQQLALGGADEGRPPREVIGVSANVRHGGRGVDAEPQLYVPYGQFDTGYLSLVLEHADGAAPAAATLRRLVDGVHPGLPVDRIDVLATRYRATNAEMNFLVFVVSVFAGIGLVLAVVGTYATAAHALSRRLRELGIRVALGANARDVFRHMIVRALGIAAAGIVVGTVLAVTLTRFLRSYIFGITSHDPASYAAACLLIGACAVLAAAGPALRAARVDPNRVLRGN
jgi:putative ABC transport system permease protein